MDRTIKEKVNQVNNEFDESEIVNESISPKLLDEITDIITQADRFKITVIRNCYNFGQITIELKEEIYNNFEGFINDVYSSWMLFGNRANETGRLTIYVMEGFDTSYKEMRETGIHPTEICINDKIWKFEKREHTDIREDGTKGFRFIYREEKCL